MGQGLVIVSTSWMVHLPWGLGAPRPKAELGDAQCVHGWTNTQARLPRAVSVRVSPPLLPGKCFPITHLHKPIQPQGGAPSGAAELVLERFY